jgi:hypothetical protein
LNGDGIPNVKSLGAPSFKLSADQVHVIPMDKTLTAHYFKLAVDQNDAGGRIYSETHVRGDLL